ncbi:uncharacterized protein [Anoplolepis gracilipes]|uniref:uncharacterized protein isoform X1 n=1 Tax=Anoplolepis gracilipes TaxID=354296 RepID=UPI003BA3AF24
MDFNDSQCPEEKLSVKMPNALPLSNSMTVPDAKHENCRMSSLSVIALEYDNSNSDVENIETDISKTDTEKIEAETNKTNVEIEADINKTNMEVEADTNKTEIETETKKIDVDEIETNTNKTDVEEKEPEIEKTNMEEIETNINKTDVEETEADINKTENQNTMPVAEKQTLQQYRTIEENVLSSCEETDSEDDSSCSSSSSSTTDSDSSSSNNDSDDITSTNNAKRKFFRKKGNKANTIKKKKEIENELDDLPPIEDLKISVPEVLCDLLGEVDKVVEQLVIVKPKPDKPTLHVDTVLFVEKGERALGKILDVFGPVSEPNYCIRFNSSEHIQESNIKVGMSVYYCPSNKQYTSLIFLHELHKMKGFDAVGDDELPAFSDDEEEQAYYESLKQKNNKDGSDSNTLRKRQRTSSFTQNKPTIEWQSNHPWNGNAKFQWKNQKRQQQAFNNNFQSHNGPYAYNNSWLQYQYQSNMHWPPVPRNMHPMFNGPSFNESGLPQYDNYNSNSSAEAKQYFQGAVPNSQSNNMQPHYPRIPSGAPLRFNPMILPLPPMGYSQFPNASFPYMSYPISAQLPMHTNALWSSLPPPPPPSTTND